MTPLTGPGSKPAWRNSSCSAAIDGGAPEAAAASACARAATGTATISHKATKIRVYIAIAPEIIRLVRCSYGARGAGLQPGRETMAERRPVCSESTTRAAAAESGFLAFRE